MSATETPSRSAKSRPPAGEVEGMMTRSQANFWGNQAPATAQAHSPRQALAVYPLRQGHRTPPGEPPAGQVSRDPRPFSVARADGGSGCRRARHHPPASEAGPRWFESSHPDCKRKGKPTGDGTRPEPGRATSLEGSTPSPSAERNVPVAERPRHRSSKPDRRVQLPPGTLTDGSL